MQSEWELHEAFGDLGQELDEIELGEIPTAGARVDVAVLSPGYRSSATARKVPIVCQQTLVLDRFDLGDYRLKQHHYEPLTRFIGQADAAAARGGIVVGMRGHCNQKGNAAANTGLSMNRAFEVVRFMQLMSGRSTFRVEIEAVGAAEPIRGPAEKSRRVELSLCIGSFPPYVDPFPDRPTRGPVPRELEFETPSQGGLRTLARAAQAVGVTASPQVLRRLAAGHTVPISHDLWQRLAASARAASPSTEHEGPAGGCKGLRVTPWWTIGKNTRCAMFLTWPPGAGVCCQFINP